MAAIPLFLERFRNGSNSVPGQIFQKISLGNGVSTLKCTFCPIKMAPKCPKNQKILILWYFRNPEQRNKLLA
jgi:hypothetical protein